jgi:hypothetical protein
MPWRSFVWSLPCLLVACGNDDRSCTAAACGGGSFAVSLVTESGRPASVRGEFRRGRTNPIVTRFNCGDGREADETACPGGIIGMPSFAGPGPVFEVRFQRPDGAFTEWQIVDLRIESVTDPDFNGPGCPCTWYEAQPEPVVVPAAAISAD